jgi:hypothetical protein
LVFGFLKSAIEHIGAALFIAAVLGLTIHWWLTKQITEDVFTAAMGYELPPELRDEIRYVYGSRLICEEHVQAVQIEDLGNNFVRITLGLERTIKNIGETPQQIPLYIATDEWGVEGYPSQILELGYQYEDERRLIVFPGDNRKEKFESGNRPQGPTVKRKSNLTLKPKKRLTIFSKCCETKPYSGEHFFHFEIATKNPRVQVTAPGFEWVVGFAHRDEPRRGAYSETVQLTGLLLPHQNIRVRWWRGPPSTESPI